MQEPRLSSGDVFERRYKVVRQIGRGSYGDVFLAENLDLGRHVAVKLLHAGKDDGRFIREGKVLATLESPHTVRLLDFGRTGDDTPYMVFEYIEGAVLTDVLLSPLSVLRTFHIVRQILVSLAEAHERGVVHRDIKPDNVVIQPDDTAKVLDFGVAKLLPHFGSVTDELTKEGSVLGTLRYMAPEQFHESREVVPATDLFSVGLIAYEMLCGERANDGATQGELIAQQLGPKPFLLPESVEITDELRAYVDRLLAKDPTVRPRDAAHAIDVLDLAIASGVKAPLGLDALDVATTTPISPEMLDETYDSEALVPTKQIESPESARTKHFKSRSRAQLDRKTSPEVVLASSVTRGAALGGFVVVFALIFVWMPGGVLGWAISFVGGLIAIGAVLLGAIWFFSGRSS